MVRVTGNVNSIWFLGEEPDWQLRYTRFGDVTVQSSKVTIYADSGNSVTDLGEDNTITSSRASIYSASSKFIMNDVQGNSSTIKSYADYATIKANGSSNYVEAYGNHDIIEISNDQNTIQSFGEHTTIKTYGGLNDIRNNSIFSYADYISVGSKTVTSYGRTYIVGSKNTTLSGGFDIADIDDHSEYTVIIHEANEQGKRISGFNETSTLMIANSTFSTCQEQDDVLVLAGDNTITLVGAASLPTLNIEEIELPVAIIRNTLFCDIELVFYSHLICDIERNIFAGLFFQATVPSDSTVPSGSTAHENTSDLQSIKIKIAEQQITDQVTFTSIRPFFEILECVEGKYFDYEYKMRIESITQSGILYTCQCCSDVDELLYEQLNYDTEEKVTEWYDSTGATLPAENKEDGYISAEDHIEQLAETLGLEYSYQAMEFVSTVDPKVPGITYADLIRSIFGWSSRVPTLLINVFIRGNKLYVIQREYEENTIDISNAKITQPVFSRELVRTFWGETPYNKTEVRTYPINTTRYLYEGNDKKRVEPLKSDTRQDADGTTVINYSYDSDGMLIKTEERSPTTVTITEHKYITGTTGNKILSEEYVTVYDLSGKKIDYRSVKHSHTNYGQAAVTAGNADSENIVSMAKNVAFDERPTPYALGKHLKSIITETTGQKQEYRKISGILPYDSSFPVVDDGGLNVIWNAIEDLNRRKKETVTLSLFDYPHIIDFNDRIILNGEEYFLSSNEISTTPRISQQQNLTLVRYY